MRKFITNGPCPRLPRQACAVLVSNPLLSSVGPTTVSTLSECVRQKCRTSTNFCVHPKFLLQSNPIYDHKHPYKGFSLEHPIVYQIMFSGFTQPVSAPLTKRGRTESETSGMMCPYLCCPFRMVKPQQLRSDSQPTTVVKGAICRVKWRQRVSKATTRHLSARPGTGRHRSLFQGFTPVEGCLSKTLTCGKSQQGFRRSFLYLARLRFSPVASHPRNIDLRMGSEGARLSFQYVQQILRRPLFLSVHPDSATF